jgi:hypothetical protein
MVRKPATTRRQGASSELQTIPGVGRSIAADLHALGIRRVTDLRHRDPQQLYEQSCALAGQHIDRCLLYVYRCAVYYASNSAHAPDKLKWWNWKDAPGVAEKARRTSRFKAGK